MLNFSNIKNHSQDFLEETSLLLPKFEEPKGHKRGMLGMLLKQV